MAQTMNPNYMSNMSGQDIFRPKFARVQAPLIYTESKALFPIMSVDYSIPLASIESSGTFTSEIDNTRWMFYFSFCL